MNSAAMFTGRVRYQFSGLFFSPNESLARFYSLPVLTCRVRAESRGSVYPRRLVAPGHICAWHCGGERMVQGDEERKEERKERRLFAVDKYD